MTFVELLVYRVVHSLSMCIWVSWDWPQTLHSGLFSGSNLSKSGEMLVRPSVRPSVARSRTQF